MDKENSSFSEIIDKYKSLFGSIADYFKKLDAKTIALAMVVFAVFYYVIVFSIYSILLHRIFWTGAFDVGIFDQGIWLLSRLINPFVTVRGLNLFGDHLTLYDVLLAPLFWLWNSIDILYIIQAVLIAGGAIPLFLYAKERLQSNILAVSVALSFLLYPALQNMNLEQFHPEALTIFFMVFTLYFVLKDNFKLFYPFLILSLAGKEEVAFTGIFIGLFLVLFRKQFKHGWIVAGISLAWYLISSRILMPVFNGVGVFSHQPITYSHWFQGMMSNLFNPAYYFENIFHPESLRYYFNLFAPLVFIPLLGLQSLFLLLPSVAINVLSGAGYFRSVEYHYNYIQCAVIFFGLIEGLHVLKNQRFRASWLNQYKALFLGVMILIFAGIFNANMSKFPLGRQWGLIRQKFAALNSENVKIRQEALKLIPPSAKVSASYSFVPHLSHRKEIYMFPNPFKSVLWNHWFQEGKGEPPSAGHADYVIVDWSNLEKEDRLILSYLSASDRYKVIYQADPIVLLKKTEHKRDAGTGMNYIVYNVDKPVSIIDDFPKKLKSKGSGIMFCLYFPTSNYYFRNLIGEEIPAEKQMALEIFGYLFVPETDQYKFEIQTAGQCLIEIDENIVANSKNMTKGFHRCKIKYLYNGNRYDLKLVLSPSHGKAYIIPDQHLRLTYSPQEFNDFMRKAEEKRREEEEFIRNLPNKILNGGFESVMGDLPRDWRLECWQAENAVCLYETDSKYKVKGKYSAKIEHRGKSDSRWVQEVEVKPNTKYKLSGWIKTVGVGSAGAGASIQIQDTGIKTETISGIRDWTHVEVNFRTKLDQKTVKVSCRLGDYGAINTGTVYFDEVTLKEVLGERY